MKISIQTHLKWLTIGLVAILGVAGCATEYGKKISAADVSFVEKGKTTKSALISRLGQPTNTVRESTGREQLIWEYLKVTPDAKAFIPYTFFDAQQSETATYTAIVNTKGIVIDYSVASGQSSSSNMR